MSRKSIDLDAIRQRLKKDKTQSNSSKMMWKPEPGNYQIRAITNPHSPENPFMSVIFHFNFMAKTWCSPRTFGEADPLYEYSSVMLSNGRVPIDKYKLAKRLEGDNRHHLAVIVRGLEHEGVKLWAFGKGIADDLFDYLEDTDWNVFFDDDEGHDIKLTITPPKDGKKYATPSVSLARKSSSLIDKKDPNYDTVMDSIKNFPSMEEIWTPNTYEELETALEKWVQWRDKSNETASATESDSETEEAVTKTASDSSESSSTLAEMSGKFDDLFPDKNQ